MATELSDALGGRKYGRGFRARCPAHDDRHPSLDIVAGNDGVPLVKCRAGCSQSAVISALKERGVWPSRTVSPTVEPSTDSRLDRDRIERARQITDAASPIGAGDPADLYLRSRGFHRPYPDPLRSIGGIRHPSGRHVDALVAVAIRADRPGPVAVQLTALDPQGGKAKLEPIRWTLGVCSGAAVWLSAVSDRVILVEGVEDALAVIQMTGEPVAAVLGTSGFTNFQPLGSLRRIVLAPDGDAAGFRILEPAGTRLAGMGIEVAVRRPPNGFDWADVAELFAERAAILEYEAGHGRSRAEKLAWDEIMAMHDG